MIEQHSSLSEKFLKKGFWLYLFSFIIAPLGYIIKIIISGELPVEEVGILYGVISLITLLSSFNDFGMTESMNHFIPKFVNQKRYDKVKSILFYAFAIQISTGLLIASIFFFGSDLLATHYFSSEKAVGVLKTFSLFFLGINIFQILSIFFISIQNTFLNKISEFVRMLSTMIFVFYIFFNDLGSLEVYSIGWIIGLYTGIGFILVFFITQYYNVYFKNVSIILKKDLFLEVFRYAIFVFLGAQAATILSQVDMQMILYILGAESAGYYTNYLSIIGIPFILIGPIFLFLFPVFSELFSKNDTQKILTIKKYISQNVISIAVMVSIGFFVFAEIIATILFGEIYILSGEILRYSIIFIVFNMLLQINFNVMAGIGKVKQRVKIISIAVVVNIIMNLLLIHFIGVYGAALATGIGWILIWVLSEISLGKIYRVLPDFIHIGKNILAFGIIGGINIVYVIPLMIEGDRIYNLGLLLLMAIIWIASYIMINKNDFSLLIQEIKKIRSSK